MNELKLQTPVDAGRSPVEISLQDGIVVLGSCFADSVGRKMSDLGFNVAVNPFGTLYNPVSICNSAARLSSGIPFSTEDCVQMGSGSDLICSFSHHTSFARKNAAEFLDNANSSLEAASRKWKSASKVIVTLGTAWCFERLDTNEIVSNCLKRDAKEFKRRALSVLEVFTLLRNMVAKNPDKEFIFSLSPIRHLKDGAHGNQLSKSTLLLAIDNLCSAVPQRTSYFPAYEIVLDELRDYRFYAEDMTHPSEQTVNYIWKRFTDFALPESEKGALEERERAFRRSSHRELH